MRFVGFGLFGVIALVVYSSFVETNTQIEPLAEAAVTDNDGGAAGAVFTEASELFPAQNLSLIGHTGKPQFLNAFADW
ncbi:MAG: hypothetical protein D6737_04015 [Chloroflexi bacterium]|nr:MAG: hypothetical protein D6737_04015 [Chloroflexota bacterium]